MIETHVEFEPHAGRGRFNAAFFRVMDGYIDWHLRSNKTRVYGGLPAAVVELGSGVGAARCARTVGLGV